MVGFAVPIQALMIPLYLAILRIGLYDSLLGLILPMAAFSLPITILVLVNFLRDVPRSLIDAMRVDGAGALRTLWSLVLPLSWPAIATVGVFDLVSSWNNFLFPLILTQSPSQGDAAAVGVQLRGQPPAECARDHGGGGPVDGSAVRPLPRRATPADAGLAAGFGS